MLTFLLLSYPDSNQDKQNQNLLCYHYTIGQSLLCSLLKSGAKVEIKCVNAKYFGLFLFARRLERLNFERVYRFNYPLYIILAHGLVAWQA